MLQKQFSCSTNLCNSSVIVTVCWDDSIKHLSDTLKANLTLGPTICYNLNGVFPNSNISILTSGNRQNATLFEHKITADVIG